jgi:hypothetical protein
MIANTTFRHRKHAEEKIMTDIIIIRLDYKHTRMYVRTEDRWFDITGCQPDLNFSGVSRKAKEVAAQYVAELYAKSITGLLYEMVRQF